ncbi:MAG TPA: adenylate cyclase regulatory domain-containing protein [Actinomycetota bacterium]|nr:adenylate cyclase regulatory domain-containing protein [Actinomycetota bacterium]
MGDRGTAERGTDASLDLPADLFEGVEGPEATKARRDLVEWLLSQGVTVDELRRAIREDRLTLLPVERVFGRHAPTLSAYDVAMKCGLDVEFLDRLWRAVGLAVVEYTEPAYTEDDAEAARLVKTFLDAGIPPHAVLQVARTLGRGMSSLAAVVFDEVGTGLMQPGDNELDIALRWADAGSRLSPMLSPLLDYVLRLHQREEVRQSVVSAADLVSKGLPGARWIAVCFIDAVGFTSLSEQLSPDEVGAVAQTLSDYAVTAAKHPVALVKTIGDAAMLVSPEVDALLEATFEVVAMAEADRAAFPQLRAGVAAGEAVRRAGDWYGQPVNVANRVTGRARPGSVLTTDEVRRAASGQFRWSAAGRARLKGVSNPVRLFRVRPG